MEPNDPRLERHPARRARKPRLDGCGLRRRSRRRPARGERVRLGYYILGSAFMVLKIALLAWPYLPF